MPQKESDPKETIVKLGGLTKKKKYAAAVLAVAVLFLGAGVGAKLLGDKNRDEVPAPRESSFFSSVGDAIDGTLTSGGEDEGAVEVVDVKTGERAVAPPAGGESREAAVPNGEGEAQGVSDTDGSQEGDSGEESAPSPPPSPQPKGKININTAGSAELQEITGVGPVIAGRIIEYRNEHGLFRSIEEIENVNGIGPATFEKMKNEITVGDVPPAPPPSETPAPAPAPAPSPSPTPPPPPPQDDGTGGKININTAGLEELQEITGVGPVIAQRIIDYRTANGPFQSIEEIKNVKGIGDATFEKMKDEIII